jgi:predicted RNA-binding Zn-ribbon protein involved in translation (DUF1610 family)
MKLEQILEAKYAFSDFMCEECGTAFAENDAFAGPIDEPKKHPVEDHYELFCPNCGSNNVNRITNEAKYHRQKFPKGGWDPETKETDPFLSPTERGHVAGYAPAISLDYNEETGEYNPYPLGSREFQEYEAAFVEAVEDMKERFPHI